MKTPDTHADSASRPDAGQAEAPDARAPQAIAQPVGTWNDWIWRQGGLVWLVATACALFAALTVWMETQPGGRPLTIRFRQGYGIAAGDAVKYRGIEVGSVRKVTLAPSMRGVDVHILLHTSASPLARADSRFWIERPQLGLNRVSGLDTVVGPRYVNVRPGPESSAAVSFIEGVEAPQSIQDIASEAIVVRFEQGFGLTQGDPVRLRGITVGEVLVVRLDEGRNLVEAQIQLLSDYADLAREGTQFWVEHPQVGFRGVRGLDTLVGGRYVAVSPGPLRSARTSEFFGANEAPVGDLDPDGLLLTLEGEERFGLQPGAPISFRGVKVGRVVQVKLAPDAGSVEARVRIRREYTGLVRENSRFWSVSGIDLNFGLRGFRLDADTLETIAAGGAAFATPNVPGPPVTNETRFEVVAKPEASWLRWRPKLAWGEESAQAPALTGGE